MQLRPLVVQLFTAGSMFLIACQKEPSSAPSGEAQLQAASAPAAHACPMSVTGATVTASDVPSGIALDFSTTAGTNEVAELQRRVHRMAEVGAMGLMRGPGAGGGRAGRAAGRDAAGVARPRVRVEDTPSGARVTLEPIDPQGLDALRTRVRGHVPRMASNRGCMSARESQ